MKKHLLLFLMALFTAAIPALAFSTSVGDKYQLVKSVDDITLDGQYILCYDTYAMGSYYDGEGYFNAISNGVSINDDIAEIVNSDIVSFNITTGSTTEVYGIQISGSKYIRFNGSTLDTGNKGINADVTFSINETSSQTKIKFNNTDDYYLYYKSSAFKASNSGSTPKLYKKLPEADATPQATVTVEKSYTIEFTTSTSTDGSNLATNIALSQILTSESQQYVSSLTEASTAYYACTNGIRLGSSKNNGYITLSLASLAQVQATRIEANLAWYGSDTSANFTVGANADGSKLSGSSTKNTTYTLPLAGTETLTKIGVNMKRGYVKAITVYYNVEEEIGGGETETVASPTFDPVDGSTVKVGDVLTISCATDGATLSGTIGDFEFETENSTYTYTFTEDDAKAGSVDVRAYAEKGSNNSDEVKATYFVEANNQGGTDPNPGETLNAMYNFSEMYSADTDIVGTQLTKEQITLVFDKGSNSNAPKYFANGTAVRAYGGNTFTISAQNAYITKVEITSGSGGDGNAISANIGSYKDGSTTAPTTAGVWIAPNNETEEVTFTIAGTSKNRRIATIDVTYIKIGDIEPDPDVAPRAITFEPAAGNITTLQAISLSVDDEATTPVTITYSIDNNTYDQTYSEPFNLEAGEHTVYVKASNNGGDIEAKAEYIVEAINAYQIVFDDNSSDATTDITSATLLGYIKLGKEYVDSAEDISKVYKGKTGIKFGTSSAVGTVTLNLTDAGKVSASKIVVNAATYNASSTTLSVNGKPQNISGTDFADYTFDVVGEIEKIELATSGSEKRGYVKGITVYYDEPELQDYEALNVYEDDGVGFVYGETAQLELGDNHPAINYAYDPEGVIEISEDGTITALNAGITEVTASWDADNTWNEGEVTFIVNVEKRTFEPTFAESYNITLHETFDLKEILGEERPNNIEAISIDNKVSVSDDLVVTAEKVGKDTIMLSWEVSDTWKAGEAEITFNVTPIPVPTGLTASQSDKAPVEDGTEVTFTAEAAETFTITTYGIDGTPYTRTVSPEEAKVIIDKMHRRFDVVANNEGGSTETLNLFYNLGSAVSGEVYKRVSDVSQIHDGDKIIIGILYTSTNGSNYHGFMVNQKPRTGTGFHYAESEILSMDDKDNMELAINEFEEGTMIFEVESSTSKEGAFNLKYVTTEGTTQYLQSSPSSNALELKDYGTDYTVFFDANNNNVTFASSDNNGNDNVYCIMMNPQSPLFSSYRFTQLPITIFRLMTIEPTIVTYQVGINYTTPNTNNGQIATMAVTAPNDGAEGLGNAEDNNGILKYSAQIEGEMQGRFTIQLEDMDLAGHVSQINAGIPHDPIEDSNPNREGCDGNHEGYVYVGTNFGLSNENSDNFAEHVEGIKLIDATHPDAAPLSTNPNEYHGLIVKHQQPVITINVNPFREITMGLDTANNGTTVGVSDIAVDNEANGEVEYYNLQGVRVVNAVPGNVYIVRQGNTASKVLVK